jgi:putative holliday junction resolvase
MSGRILCVDPGDARIGIAISDPTGTIANPLTVIQHISRVIDAAGVATLAQEHGAVLIVVGQPLDWDGTVGPAARKSARTAEAIRLQTNLPVELWDESGSTQQAREARQAMGVKRSKRSGHLDELAATIILQSYLDAHIKKG